MDKPKHVKAYIDRHGRPRWYFRRKGFPAVVLPMPGAPGFWQAYEAAMSKEPFAFDERKIAFLKGSLGWVIEKFMASAEFNARKAQTVKADRIIFDEMRKQWGGGLLKDLRAKHVKVMRNYFHEKNSASWADSAVSRISVLWEFADQHLDLELEANPTVGVKRVHVRKEENERQPWTEEVFAAVDANASTALRLAVLLGRYTGQRLSDVCAMTWSQFNGDTIKVRQKKTGAYVEVPCHKNLRAVLKAMPRRGEFILTGSSGKPLAPTGLISLVQRTMIRLGIKGYSFHGLRKNAAIALTEAGCTVEEVMAVTGHASAKMAMFYAKRSERKKLARSAISKWEAAG